MRLYKGGVNEAEAVPAGIEKDEGCTGETLDTTKQGNIKALTRFIFAKEIHKEVDPFWPLQWLL
ncbi:hypothetical protein K3495_g637 [Podosphaera aphanis]|nr:hypothetical protein K3495_g637 [Podosphaera aphanis]